MARVGATSAFAGDPQPVEVFHRGRWYAGDLLGWRHQEDGSCQARVRCVVDGLRHSAWVTLSDLRLPRPVDQVPAPRPALPRPQRPRPVVEDDDTRPHLLLPRTSGRPPVPVVAPGARTAPAARGVPATRAVPVQDAVRVG
jgi:hypothetical protein